MAAARSSLRHAPPAAALPSEGTAMARILGAITASHTPTIGFAFDRQKQDDPAWAPIFEAFRPIQRWLEEKKPDVLAQMTIAEYATLGGVEGAEVIMWLIARGALSGAVRKVHQSYYLPSMT